MGVSEISGPEANKRIIEFHAETQLKATSDETPWCSAFACAMMEWSGIPSTRSAAARSWLDWGVTIERPSLGCVVVLSRGSSPSQGHVGFYTMEGPEWVEILAGNQDNKVCLMRFPKSQILGLRLPGEEYWSPTDAHDYQNDTRFS